VSAVSVERLEVRIVSWPGRHKHLEGVVDVHVWRVLRPEDVEQLLHIAFARVRKGGLRE
jgi:hypothetical protein